MSSPRAVSARQRKAAVEDTETRAKSESKRRKVRKGTHSCWECKRRKMKCIFDPLVNGSCNGCRRRGSKCVGQEFSEEVSPHLDKTDRVMRVETLVDQLIQQTGGNGTTSDRRTPMTPSEDGARTDPVLLTPASMDSEPLPFLGFYKSSQDRTIETGNLPADSELNNSQSAGYAQAPQGKYEKLSHFLHKSLPSREYTQKILKANHRHSVLAYEILTIPYTTLEQTGMRAPDTLLEMPGRNIHPVLIARYMLQLAIFLQHLSPDLHEDMEGLSEPPRATMQRLADLAISLVTTNEDLLGSIEGLECVMIESMYQANIGNLRRSWVAGRRAMGIAQLMGLNRSDRAQYKVLDPKSKHRPQHMWFRILFLDHHLSLMLGLPQGSLDRGVASDAMLANDTPLGRLERIHCALASRILERNESNISSHHLAVTRTLDVELQRAARSLPSKWWLAPDLATASLDSQALFWEMQRLFAQVLHYNLLNQLHLPYMLRSSSTERKYEYSRITCVNASREVLSRFITLRSFNRIAFSCRMVDFLALMAAMTLLLAHLDSHHSSGAENLLAHQYLSDRAMIEQAQENMKEINRLNSDALSAQSADLLRRLLAIEIDTADDDSSQGGRVSVQEAGAETTFSGQDDDGIVSVHIPYFGIIKIAREGVSREIPNVHVTAATNRQTQPPVVGKPGPNSAETLRAQSAVCLSGLSPGGSGNIEGMRPVIQCYSYLEAPSIVSPKVSDAHEALAQGAEASIPSTDVIDGASQFAPQLQNGLSELLLQHGDYPGLTAGGEDWAFQGVDMAFFDSLMRSTGSEGNKDVEWTR
ncbi:hypothetical protein BKA56DRAFT_314895 [Ilyonectria sp. MPI-CAGE-AT-0026]|nr:hypothetical protein BKA56DRAFT_314895 [Ilyonectria sp. MPI-CAGE-AT-0026]